MMPTDTFTDPYTDDGVLHTVDRRMEALQPLEGLPDIVLIDRLRFRLECALQREQLRVDEARLTTANTITDTQYEGLAEHLRLGGETGRAYGRADDVLRLLGITIKLGGN